jgi:hypothetical protein
MPFDFCHSPKRERGENIGRNVLADRTNRLRFPALTRGAMSPKMVYLLTFNCYGARLAGDERGRVERGAGYRDPNPGLLKYCREGMKQQPYVLDLPQPGSCLR